MKLLLRKIVSILVKWFQPRHKTVYSEELPDYFDDRIIYIIGRPDNPWLIAFKCPCGCDSKIYLNLLVEAKPKWRLVTNSRNRISISPSIWRKHGCQSHFFVTKSKIDWITFSFDRRG